jgi:hypothetical protein
MSFEVEPFQPTSNNGNPAQSLPPIMREERSIDPYRVYTPKTAPVSSPEVQQSTSSEEKTVTLSPQVAALARREQKFRQQQEALTKEKQALQAEREEIAQLKAIKEKLAAKDYSGLDNLIDYNDYSQYQVSKLNGADPVQEEIKKLHGKISDIEKTTEENISKQFEAAVQERRLATQDLIEKSENFPRIKKAKAHEVVVHHILDVWENDNKEISVEEAAKEVEQALLEKAKQWAALLEEKKAEEIVEEAPKKTLPPMKAGLKTLTNQLHSGDPSMPKPKKPLHLMSDGDRWAEARRRSEEKLKLQMNR